MKYRKTFIQGDPCVEFRSCFLNGLTWNVAILVDPSSSSVVDRKLATETWKNLFRRKEMDWLMPWDGGSV